MKQCLGSNINNACVSEVSLWTSPSLVQWKVHALVVEVHQMDFWRTSGLVYLERNPVCISQDCATMWIKLYYVGTTGRLTLKMQSWPKLKHSYSQPHGWFPCRLRAKAGSFSWLHGHLVNSRISEGLSRWQNSHATHALCLHSEQLISRAN